MKIDIWYFLNSLTRDKIFPDFKNEEVLKAYDPYMINRWISMVEIWIPTIHVINQYSALSKEDHYRFLFNTLPRTSVRFNYLKKGKKDELKEDDRKLLMKHFGFGVNDLEASLDVLTEQQIENIRMKYKYGKTR